MGVKSNYDEFMKTYEKMSLTISEHPDYINIRKGETQSETAKIFHEKYPADNFNEYWLCVIAEILDLFGN